MTTSLIGAVVFYGLAALAIAGATWVAFAPNIVHSAFALLATFLGVAGLYAFLSADLVAVIQLLVYVGGVLILILFAVMLTARIADVKVSNPSIGAGLGFVMLLAVFGAIAAVAIGMRWPVAAAPGGPTAAGIGDALLGPFVLPFEVISLLLLAALIGAVTLARSTARPGRARPAPVEGRARPDPVERPAAAAPATHDAPPTTPGVPS